MDLPLKHLLQYSGLHGAPSHPREQISHFSQRRSQVDERINY